MFKKLSTLFLDDPYYPFKNALIMNMRHQRPLNQMADFDFKVSINCCKFDIRINIKHYINKIHIIFSWINAMKGIIL